MVQPTNDDAGHARTGALEALLDVAQDLDIVGDYRTVSAAFDARRLRADHRACVATPVQR